MWNHQNKQRSAHTAFASNVKSLTGQAGSALVNADDTAGLLSFESMSGERQESVKQTLSDVQSKMKGFLSGMVGDAGLGFEGFGGKTPAEQDARLDIAAQAAAVVVMAAGDVTGYARKAYTVEQHEKGVNRLIGFDSAGTDHRLETAFEAFDSKELTNHLPYSATFAAFGSRQDEFCETFFNTAVVTPDQAGLDIEITIPKVFTNSTHPTNGNPTNFDKKNLIDAVVDASILKDHATRLIPHANPDNSNADKFVPVANHASVFERQQGFDIPTRPLKAGVDIGLIGVAAYAPILAGGVLSNTDAVDASIELESVWLAFDATTPAIGFDTSYMPRNRFTKTVEGNFKAMQLTFSSRDLVIDGTKKNSANLVPAQFQAIIDNEWKVYLKVQVHGEFNVEFGSVNLTGFPVKVDLIQTKAGVSIGLTDGVGKTLVDALEELYVAGYTLKANRTNSNLRTRGHVVDVTVERERHTLPLGSPITFPSPVHETNRDGDIKIAINASRIRNSNLGVTVLLTYADTLEKVVKGPKRDDGVVPAIAGAARWLVQPWFERRKLDVSASMTSEKSIERAGDIALTLVNAIRDMAYRAYRDSRYQAALDAASQGSGEKPTLIIGTDSIIERHLMLAGDDRTFGTVFEKFKIVSSQDSRVYGKIFITFSRGSSDPSDVLSFGTHAWMPELTGALPINRAGATYHEAMVQPRNLHVPKLPILGIIEVAGLSKALVEKTPVLMVGPSDIVNPWLPVVP